MGIVVLSVIVAVVAARGRAGDRFTSWESVPFSGLWLFVAALVLLFLGFLLDVAGFPAGPVYAFSLATGAVVAALLFSFDRALAGTGLLAAGLFLNAFVVGINAGMPVSAHAAARAGVSAHSVIDARHHLANRSTSLGFLGDVIPVPLPLRPEVISFGDLLAAAGLAQLTFMALRRRTETSQRPPLPPPARDRRRTPEDQETSAASEPGTPSG